jgi:integrase
MVYRRGTRPSFYFQGRTRTGWEQMCSFTPDKRLAEKIDGMWEMLAARERAWDVLERVHGGPLTAAELYDVWLESGRNVEALRRRLNDADLEALVEPWHAAYLTKVTSDSAAHALVHVRWLIPRGTPLRASDATPAFLAHRLAAYLGKRNTRRKVHSSWSVFFDYCVTPVGALERNPMHDVERPNPEAMPIRFYEGRDVERIVGWFAEPAQRAYFAMLYGTGMDVSDPLPLLRGDLIEHTHEVRAPGTKTRTRDRVALIADWAWPIVWAHAKTLHPDTRLFPQTWDRWDVGRWHRQATGDGVKDTHGAIVTPGLQLPRRHPPKCARHHWAVRMLRSGAPPRLVMEQLGHATTQQTLDVYGQFLGTTDDRKRAEQQATRFEKARRKASGGTDGEK